MSAPSPVVVVHGGAGHVPVESRPRHAEGCAAAARAGLAVLMAGGSPLDAAQRAVEVLEDDPVFNAGTGACLTSAGTLELDASLMEGTTLRAGAVAGLSPFPHPIRVCRSILEEGRHVLYAGQGADAFARSQGFVDAPQGAMITEAARDRLARFLAGEAPAGWAGNTVGAVVCAADGRVAAATSTGGTVGKRPGRVGDTPLVGAGTYADDLTGACSATGIGETIIRVALAHEVCVRLAAGADAARAAQEAITLLGERVGGTGGVIVVDRLGRVGVERNTETMSYAVARAGEPIRSGY